MLPMAFDPVTFFDDLVTHFRQRADIITSLSVMCAIERWVQWEAAFLLDTKRDRYGIGGGDPASPNWWVTCEYQDVDIWAENYSRSEGIALELKAIHNNKNFYGKIAGLRSDVSPGLKHVPATAKNVERHGLFVLTYARYADSRRYPVLRTGRGGPPVLRDQLLQDLRLALGSNDPWYGGSVALTLAGLEEIASLEKARYIEAGHGCAVWLGRVTPV